MLKPVLAGALIFTLIGCAPSYEYQRQQFAGASTDDLCLVAVTKRLYSRAATDELNARSAKCDWNKINAYLQAQNLANQETMATLMMLNQANQLNQPYTFQTPQQNTIRCRSTYQLGGVNTTCQ